MRTARRIILMRLVRFLRAPQGMAASQMKSFWDSTGGLWSKGALAGKPAGIFFSTGTQNGGQETTAMTWMTQLVHQGMVYVPLGYTAGAPQFDVR